jgi:hypothetical protein
MAGSVIGTAADVAFVCSVAGDGEALDEAFCLLQPIKTIEAAVTLLMVGIFI